jgi:hypothetical protein
MENLTLQKGPSTALPWSRRGLLLLHGRTLSVGHLAVLFACLWKILAVVAVMMVFLYAAFACVPDLGISNADLVRWQSEWITTSKIPPSFDQRLTEILARKEAILTHFRKVRDGYAAPLACIILVLAVLLYVLVWVIWNYVYEGLAERRIKNAEDLLSRARDALPEEFPNTRLVSAPVTFVRYRIRGGITTFLSNRLLVLLCNDQKKEFQFALFHEAYHLRCFDPLCSSISKSLRRILAFLGAAACALIGMDWVAEMIFGHHARSPLAPIVRFVASIAIFSFMIRRLWRLDVPFLKHKELLADLYARRSQPNANLDLVYDREIPAQTHPTRGERIQFLLEGRCTTAYKTFFATQEVILCCVFLVSSRIFDDFMGTLPRILEFPSFILALCGSLIFGAEAWAHPLPIADREPVLRRSFLILILCFLLYGKTHAPWFSGALLIINVLLLLRIARSEVQSSQGEEESARKGHRALWTWKSYKPASFARALESAGLVSSWVAIFWIIFAALAFIFDFATLRGLGGPLPQGVPKLIPIGGTLVTLMECGVLGFAAVRNLKRPNVLTLSLEWFFYGAMLLGFCSAGIWLSYRVSPQGWGGIVLESLRLPWGDTQEMNRVFRVDLARLLWVMSIPELALATFYGWRVRAAYERYRKEREE